MEGVITIVVILATATAFFFVWQRREGVIREVSKGAVRLTARQLKTSLGAHATFVQFSTPLCSKCPGTRALLQEVVADNQEVKFVEIDASENVDLARTHGVMRTPTVIVLDSYGVPVVRMSGTLSHNQAYEALTRIPPPDHEYSI